MVHITRARVKDKQSHACMKALEPVFIYFHKQKYQHFTRPIIQSSFYKIIHDFVSGLLR